MLNYNNVKDIFKKLFPEFKIYIDNIENYWRYDIEYNEVPVHIFFGDILNGSGLLQNLLLNNEEILLKRLFDFFEEMANSKDIEVNNLLQVSILEYLWDDKKILNKAISYMGDKTKLLNDEISNYMNL